MNSTKKIKQNKKSFILMEISYLPKIKLKVLFLK